ncbi:MAG: hypothetical protein M3Y41_11905 [Pseudomonadota bacterium]|nr:hypothetical protein [Pseudomonadota bacterium]
MIAVLEEIAGATRAALERIDRRLDGIDERLWNLAESVAELHGLSRALPSSCCGSRTDALTKAVSVSGSL